MRRSRPDEPPLRRVAMISMHTSPLAPPGSGDAGGLNVYVDAVARELSRTGVEVDVFTRAPQAPRMVVADGYRVFNLGPASRAQPAKERLAAQVPGFALDVLRAAGRLEPFDAVHTHYWLSGEAGRAASAHWGVPWVHSMHTLGRVKNAQRGAHEAPEPAARIVGEERIVRGAHALIANTAAEASDLAALYGADPGRVSVVVPGVDGRVFAPGDRAAARAAVGMPDDKIVLLFVGRLQPLKAPDLLLRAAALLVRAEPGLRDRLRVVVCGGPSGASALSADGLAGLAAELGIGDLVRLVPPVPRRALADWYRAADATVMPSYNESFGLVALESQACGTPVVATRVGGLATAVLDGTSGVLVDGHDPAAWARALAGVVDSERLRRRLSRGALRHAQGFSWGATAAGLATAYALAERRGVSERSAPVAG